MGLPIALAPRDVKARASAWEAGNCPVGPGNMLKVLTSHKKPPMVPTKRPHQDGSCNRRGGALGERPMAGRHGGQLGRNPALSYLRRGGQMGGREGHETGAGGDGMGVGI